MGHDNDFYFWVGSVAFIFIFIMIVRWLMGL